MHQRLLWFFNSSVALAALVLLFLHFAYPPARPVLTMPGPAAFTP